MEYGYFFVRISRFPLTLDTIDILCLAYSNFCMKKKKKKLSVISNVNKNRRIRPKNIIRHNITILTNISNHCEQIGPENV